MTETMASRLLGLWERTVCLLRGHNPYPGSVRDWCTRCGSWL